MKKSSKNLLTALLLNMTFVIIELVGGLFTNSIAILSDAIHDFGDCIAIGSAVLLEKKSERKPDKNYTYGYRRYSIISALFTNLILIIGGVVVIYSSVRRIIFPEQISGLGMVGIAIAGVVANGIAFLKTAKSKNINEKSINLHMLEDVLGWVVVLIGSVFISIFNIYIIDPILSIAVTLFIFYNATRNIIAVCSVILEKVPDKFSIDNYKESVLKLDGIAGIGHLHIWSLDGETLLGTVQIIVKDDLTEAETQKLKQALFLKNEEFNIQHMTMQLDRECEKQECGCHLGNNE